MSYGISVNLQLLAVVVMSALLSNCGQVQNQDSGVLDVVMGDNIFYVQSNVLVQGQCPVGVVPNRANCPSIGKSSYILFKPNLTDFYADKVKQIESKIKDETASLRVNSAEVNAKRVEIKSFSDAKSKLQASLGDIKTELKNLTDEVSRLKTRIADLNQELSKLYTKLAQSPNDQLILKLVQLRVSEVSDETTKLDGVNAAIDVRNAKVQSINDETANLNDKIRSAESEIATFLNSLPVASQKLDDFAAQLNNVNTEIAAIPEVLTYLETADIVVPEQILENNHKLVLKNFRAVMEFTAGKMGLPEGKYKLTNSESVRMLKILENTVDKIVYEASFTQKTTCAMWTANVHVPKCINWNYETIAHKIECTELKIKCKSNVGYEVDHITNDLIIAGKRWILVK